DVLDFLTRHPAVDVVAFARGPGVFRVLSRAGTGEIHARREGAGPEYDYRVIGGRDPLDIAPALRDRWMPLAGWVRATAADARPAAVPGLASFLASGRGGEVVFT